jgi:hypothetical protein
MPNAVIFCKVRLCNCIPICNILLKGGRGALNWEKLVKSLKFDGGRAFATKAKARELKIEVKLGVSGKYKKSTKTVDS